MNVPTIDTTPIQRFMNRVSKMSALKQSDVRISMTEALELSSSLAALLTNQMASPVVPVYTTIVNNVTTSPTTIDGGSLKK